MPARRFSILAAVFVLLVGLTASSHAQTFGPGALPEGLYAEIITPRGVVLADLFFEKTPLTVANFVGLAEGTLGPKSDSEGTRKPYFNGLKFHRVVPNFVVQGGDPLGTGEGGPGYEFPDEFVPGLRHTTAGVLSMANSGPDTNGSQFFITLRETNRLNYLHTVFGRVIRGVEILPQIQQGDTMQVKIVRQGAAANAFRADEASFAALAAATPKAIKPHFEDADNLLPSEPPRAKAFNYKLANVERFTGLRLYVRLFARFMPDVPGATPADATRRLATSLDVAEQGALAVYFADTAQWHLVVGQESTRTFRAPQGAPDQPQTNEAFIAHARAAGDALIDAATKTLPADKPLADSQKIKLKTDAMIDSLIDALEPAPTR